MTDNEALRTMIALLRAINSRLAFEYDRIEGDSYNITDSEGIERAEVSNAVKTVVVNRSATSQIYIYEDDVLVGTAEPLGTWASPTPLTGRLTVKAQTTPTTVNVATYIKDEE